MEFDEQRHRMQESNNENISTIENGHKRAQNELKKQIENEQMNRDRLIEQLQQKHMQDMNQVREKLQIEKEEWQSNYMKKIESQVRQQQVNI